MTSRVDQILKEVSALCAHYPDQDLSPILRQLLGHWTRKQNLISKGKRTSFTPFEIDEIIDFLEQRIAECRHV